MNPFKDIDWEKLEAEARKLAQQDFIRHEEFQKLWGSIKPIAMNLKNSQFRIELICEHVAWETFKLMREHQKN